MRKYVYAIFISDTEYDDITFESAENAIYAVLSGQKVAVLDALSLEYLGCIE